MSLNFLVLVTLRWREHPISRLQACSLSGHDPLTVLASLVFPGCDNNGLEVIVLRRILELEVHARQRASGPFDQQLQCSRYDDITRKPVQVVDNDDIAFFARLNKIDQFVERWPVL